MAIAIRLLRDFRDLLSPRYCAICGTRLNTSEQKVCTNCLLTMPYVGEMDFVDNPITRLFWGKIPIERGFSYIHYSRGDNSHKLLMQLKYAHRLDVGRWAGRIIAGELLPKGFFDGIDCIVPVPLHWRRRLKRGYNQSEQIARGVASVTRLPLLKSHVCRIRNNETQTHKSADERMRNVENLFRVVRPIPYHHILIIDDVLTTGATLYSCAKAILDAQPDTRISILTLAKA